MAREKTGATLPTLVAAADFTTAGQHRFVVIDSNGKAALAGAGVAVDGVLQNNPDVDQAATVWGPGTLSKIEAGAAVATGAQVTPDATGRAVDAATTNYIAGKIVDAAGGAGEIASVWITQPGRLA